MIVEYFDNDQNKMVEIKEVTGVMFAPDRIVLIMPVDLKTNSTSIQIPLSQLYAIRNN